MSSESGFLAHVNRLADRFAERIEALKPGHSKLLVGLRQLGLMMGLELKNEICGPLLTKTAYDNDLLMIYANNDPRVCQFLPPLVMDIQKVDWIMDRLEKALTAARRLKPLANIKFQVEKIVKRLS
jgi:acetylornithine/succinyldiaminopimelate/putrescine aminotransferase